jgi:hypothetical protein
MKKKESKSKFVIEGRKERKELRWTKINCVCSQDPNNVLESYPLKDCIHCKCQESEKDFLEKINYGKEYEVNKYKDNKIVGKLKVNHVKIVRDKKTDEIIGFIQYPE